MTIVMIFLALQDPTLLQRAMEGKDVPSDSSSIGRAASVIAYNVKTRTWALEKEDSDIVSRSLKLSDDKVFTFLVSEYLKKRDGLKLNATRTLILAYLDQGSEIPNIELKAKSLSLVKSDSWVTFEGNVVAKVRSKEHRADEIERIVPPGFELPYFAASEILQAAYRGSDLPNDLARAAKAFRPVSGPLKKNADEIRAILEKQKFCKNCQGTASRPCDYGPCEGGKIVKCCATCSGTGKNPQSYHAPNFQTPCPNPGNNGKHKWVEDCTRCQGTGKTPCKNCKAPWKAPAAAEVFDSSPCDFCSSTGWALQRVQLPCPCCQGLGSVIRPPKPLATEKKQD
jgi:hypothetical protein